MTQIKTAPTIFTTQISEIPRLLLSNLITIPISLHVIKTESSLCSLIPITAAKIIIAMTFPQVTLINLIIQTSMQIFPAIKTVTTSKGSKEYLNSAAQSRRASRNISKRLFFGLEFNMICVIFC